MFIKLLDICAFPGKITTYRQSLKWNVYVWNICFTKNNFQLVDFKLNLPTNYTNKVINEVRNILFAADFLNTNMESVISITTSIIKTKC